jgi:hypothetical protein
MFDFKSLITMEVKGKIVLIELHSSEDAAIKIVNLLLCECLDTFQDMEMVKYYKNRVDYFTVMPQFGWLPVELLVEIKKWLKI